MAQRVDIPFPRGSLPGQRPGEGQGRLLNAFCELDAGIPTWRPCPGMTLFADTLLDTPRGMIDINGLLYAARNGRVVTVTPNGVVTLLTGSLSGTGRVTWARNNKATTPDVVCVTENGAFTVTPTTVSSFADPDLPQPIGVCQLDGYLIFPIGDGRLFASDLNAITVNALSFTTCESNPDGLLRAVTYGQQVYAFGQKTIEVYQDQGNTPFPLGRVQVIPIGLIGQWAIAGHEDGWSNPLAFVATDGTVRKLDGYTPTVISTKDVDRAIQSVADKSTLEASVQVVAGHAIWRLSSATWTWEYNFTTGYWNERTSLNQQRFRASTSVYFASQWIVGDVLTNQLLTMSEAALDEVGTAISMVIESGPTKQFPSRITGYAAFFDWTTGQAPITGSSDATNPSVSIQWSHDGGATWSTPLTRPLPLGRDGDYSREIRQNRMGLSTQHGIRFRQTTSSPVYKTLRGGRIDVEERLAA